jgi:hypothetical protein
VWVSDWGANAILRFDPKTEKFEPFPLPDRYARVRRLATDGDASTTSLGRANLRPTAPMRSYRHSGRSVKRPPTLVGSGKPFDGTPGYITTPYVIDIFGDSLQMATSKPYRYDRRRNDSAEHSEGLRIQWPLSTDLWLPALILTGLVLISHRTSP